MTCTCDLDTIRDSDGKLPKYTAFGGYPYFYLDKQGNVLCADCANRDVDQTQDVIGHDANWEDNALFCDDCGKRIESAYAEDDTDK